MEPDLPSERVLIVAPIGHDAPAMTSLLEREGFSTFICQGPAECVQQIDVGVGAALLTEEALELPQIDKLLESLSSQPPWSELPMIILTTGGESRLQRLLELTAKAAHVATLLERPISAATLVRSVQVALSSRRRQYQVRDLLEEQLRAHERLKEGETQLRFVTDHAPALIVHCGADRRFLFVNAPYAKRFGLRPQDVHGKLIPEVVGEKAYSSFRDYVDAALRGERMEFEVEIRYDQIGPHWMHCVYVPDMRDNRVVGFVALIQDVTARKKAEIAQAMLAAIVESSGDAIVSKTLEGIVTSWNEGAEQIFGYSAAEMIGQSITRIIPDELQDQEIEILAKIRSGTRLENSETERMTKDGRKIPVSLTISPIRDAAGNIIGASKIGRNISQRKAAEQSLRLAKEQAEAASRAKDHFLAVLSHELRTPLTPVLMAVRTLGLRGDLPEIVREGLSMIQRNVEIEVKLIDDLLDVTRITRGKLEIAHEEFDVHETIRNAVDVSRPDFEARQQNLEVSLEAEKHQIEGDRMRLEQAFWNLLKNASKFTPEKGEIRVESRNKGDYLLVTVSDAGDGIDPCVMAAIFEPFEQGSVDITRKHGGLGLGLAIAKAVVEAHGGELRAESPGRGKGSIFTIDLPNAYRRLPPIEGGRL